MLTPCLRRYKLRVLFDAVDMRWDWPVDVNYHEAKAFAAWRTERVGRRWGGAPGGHQPDTRAAKGRGRRAVVRASWPRNLLSGVGVRVRVPAAQDGSAVQYRLITEAEHNLLRNDRDR